MYKTSSVNQTEHHVSSAFLLFVAGVAVRGADVADVFPHTDWQSGVGLLHRGVVVGQIAPVNFWTRSGLRT